jgi:DNA-binding SARP family transcriptional activator
MALEFKLLGAFEVWHAGVQVDLGDLQQRYILAVLVLHANRGMQTARLEDIVWPKGKPKSSLVATYINRLRRAFRDAGVQRDPIERVSGGYLLRVEENWIDVNRLTALFEQANKTDQRDRAKALLHEAVGLWRGQFLEDLDIDRIGGGAVISPREAYLDALGDLAGLELEDRNHRWVRDKLRPQVNDDPTRQRLVELLMRALLANGDRVGAVQVYHQCREALFDELGMEPDRALRALHQLAQREEPPSTLPARPVRFTGRAEEFELIDAWSQRAGVDDHGRMLWISGTPGVGKTALALHSAYQLRGRFPDGQLFVRLNGFSRNVEPTTTAEALRQLLVGLGVPAEQIPQRVGERETLYQSRLLSTRTMVVLDDAVSEEQVAPLLPPAGCFAIVTSRRVSGVQASETMHLQLMRPAEAVALFRELVGADRTQRQTSRVAQIVELCGYLPIRIKTMAAQLRRHPRWPLDHLVELLEQPVAATDEATAAYTVSYEQLSEQQRLLFRLMGHNPGHDLSTPAAAAFCGVPDARALLDELHTVCLLDEPVPERYLMLDPLKDYAAALPPATTAEATEALTRLLDFYLVTTASAAGTVFPFDRDRRPEVTRTSPVSVLFPDKQTALDWLTAERANLVAAIGYAARHGLAEPTWQLPVLLWRFFYTTGYQRDWQETLELARKTIESDGDSQHGLAHVLLRLSGASWRAGHPGPALDYANRALPLWKQAGNARGEADTLIAIAMAQLDGDEQDAVVRHFEAALAIYQRIDDRRGQANALDMLGILDEQRGDFQLSQQRHLAAADLLEQIGDTQSLASTLNNLGAVRRRMGLLDEAMADHHNAQRLAAEMSNHSTEAAALNNIGAVHRLAGRLDDALRYHEQAKQVAEPVANPGLRTQLYLDRGATYLARDNTTEAHKAYFSALDLARGTGDLGKQALAHRGAARVMHVTGDHQEAAEHWGAALAIFDKLHWFYANEIRAELIQMPCPCAKKAS